MHSILYNWSTQWKWENAAAGAVAGLATVVALHPLDIVRTRFQVHDGRQTTTIPKYKHTVHALYTIAKVEGLRGLYAGLFPAVLGSSLSWGLYFFLYSNIKERNQRLVGRDLGPALHLLSGAEAGSIVCVLTNPVWLVKTRLQLQGHGHGTRQPYTGFYDALRSILKEEGWCGLYKGLGPGLVLVSHGALQFMAYEEGRKLLIAYRSQKSTDQLMNTKGEELLTSQDFAVLGASSKLFAVFLTYPYQVIRSRLQQRPNAEGFFKYRNTWHAFEDAVRYEGFRGLYKGIIPNLLRVVPSSSLTFLIYESLLKFLKSRDLSRKIQPARGHCD
ncbi:hypothetical protein BDL97_18G037100 [Sphagnum fallax]|nr:hypothetical protein BDL97_18G037100 [Sphagnum fallax]KAH8933577.1 hypothetical protein BDL97_18G037100 [Sphagnum fallax]KAH8933578.1 hypothetical protein BDL97_18G037100 [Sphagnum fallax]